MSKLVLSVMVGCLLWLGAGCDEPAEPAPAPSAATAQAQAVPPVADAAPAVETPAAPATPPAEPPARPRKELPTDLPGVRAYTGEGVLINCLAITAKPAAGRADPAELSFATIKQRARGDFDVTRWSTRLKAPKAGKVDVGFARLEITPSVKTQKVGVMLPSGERPILHPGWYDVLVKDGQGRTLGRLAITDSGWATQAPKAEEPAGLVAKTIREGDSSKVFFDFIALADDAPLLRLECMPVAESELEIQSEDGRTHQFVFPHAAIRLLSPEQFQTTQSSRAGERHPRSGN